MGDYYDYVSEAKLGYRDASNHNALESEAFQINSASYGHGISAGDTASEFNPRDAPPPALMRGLRGHCRPLPPSAPANLVDPSSTADWWAASPAPAPAAPTSPTPLSYIGGSYPPRLPLIKDLPAPALLHVSSANVDMHGGAVADPVLGLQAGAAPPADRFRAGNPHADILNICNNPYLRPTDAVPSTWQMQDWISEQAAGSYHVPSVRPRPASGAAPNHAAAAGERGAFHPVFSNHEHLNTPAPGAYPALHDLPQVAVLNRLRESPLHSSPSPLHVVSDSHGPFKSENDLHYWGGLNQGRLSVGKCQSMRALYEENAALRRALHSIRTGSANMILDSSLSTLQSEQGLIGELDRCIASDSAEGRALSMRERGRWAMHAPGDGSYPMWVGTPRRQWAAAPPLTHSMQAGVAVAAAAHPRRSRYHCQSQWCDRDITADQLPLMYSYSGGRSFGGWPEKEPTCWDDVQNDCAAGGAAHDHGSGMRQGTSLKQLLGGGAEKWRREGKKKGDVRRRDVEVKRKGEEAQDDDEEDGAEAEGQCAMCGGRVQGRRLSQDREGAATCKWRAAGGGGGLPLRLCQACHPRAAASLPHSTTKSPPPSTHIGHRHHVATALLMACRPTTTTTGHADCEAACTRSAASSSKKQVKGRSGRNILDLCRHFVGLSTSKGQQQPPLNQAPSPK
ncbi:hypothetical protein GOP47_0002364 [Adiantum capillus-veneris]|uniref:Uncharacterized protein n=1 Tax=Adiantum capillus-veneris TaxID=13818 RepID=A0A9D4V9Z6_ADICA|nr:hypothetical protein GOP47_0002364 [Adiantum capillus-veneris]